MDDLNFDGEYFIIGDDKAHPLIVVVDNFHHVDGEVDMRTLQIGGKFIGNTLKAQ